LINKRKVKARTLTIPMEITDPALVRAYAHPLRRQILGLLDDRTASPREIATELGAPLSNTAYHVRQLAALGLVELVSRTASRGAIEHHYTARVRPVTTDEAWAQLPEIVKRAVIDGWLQQTITHVMAAAEEGGFNRASTHHTRTAGPLDSKGWATVASELERALKRVEDAMEESRARLAKDPKAEALDATIVLMHFEGPSAEAVAQTRMGQRPQHHDRAPNPSELELDESVPPAMR
jgi:DNA-binding transcriptional ArsR family regulator